MAGNKINLSEQPTETRESTRETIFPCFSPLVLFNLFYSDLSYATRQLIKITSFIYLLLRCKSMRDAAPGQRQI
jgi:hypothetical protein